MLVIWVDKMNTIRLFSSCFLLFALSFSFMIYTVCTSVATILENIWTSYMCCIVFSRDDASMCLYVHSIYKFSVANMNWNRMGKKRRQSSSVYYYYINIPNHTNQTHTSANIVDITIYFNTYKWKYALIQWQIEKHPTANAKRMNKNEWKKCRKRKKR